MVVLDQPVVALDVDPGVGVAGQAGAVEGVVGDDAAGGALLDVDRSAVVRLIVLATITLRSLRSGPQPEISHQLLTALPT